MPAPDAVQRRSHFIDGPVEAHVPPEVFAHRPENTFGPVVQAGGFV